MEQALQIERELNEIRAKQASAEAQHSEIFRRLKKQDELIDSVHSLAMSVSQLATKQVGIEKTLNNLCGDVEEIKNKPAKRWDGLVEKLIMTVLSAVAGFILAKLGM